MALTAFIPANSLARLAGKLGPNGSKRARGGSFHGASDVLQSNRQTLQTCIPEKSIASICTRLSALNIGAFPVCDAHGALIGIISERDVVRAFAKDGARLADMHVRDLMTVEVKTCGLETPMVEAEKLMNKLRVRHLPVMDGGKLVGMLSIRTSWCGGSRRRATRSTYSATP